MTEEITFGIGCFHFWPVRPSPFTMDFESYVSAVDDALQSVQTITNIEIDHGGSEVAIDVAHELLQLSDGEDFVPHPSYLEIRFNVYIPFRIQEKLYETELPPEVFAENFRVEIRYAYHGPVCFIEPVNPTEPARPSDAVRLVRDYLEQEINSGDTGVKFDVLGPSPFHANFRLYPIETAPEARIERVFTPQYTNTPGYDEISIAYSKSAFPTIDEARTKFYDASEQEFGLFYQIVLCRAQSLSAWEKIDGIMVELVDLQGKRKLAARLKNTLLRGKYIRELFTNLIIFESKQVEAQSFISNSYRDSYSNDERSFIKSYVDEEIAQQPSFPTKQANELALFLENRRSKSIELLVVLLSALVGGIAGSVITILVSGLHA